MGRITDFGGLQTFKIRNLKRHLFICCETISTDGDIRKRSKRIGIFQNQVELYDPKDSDAVEDDLKP